MEGNEKEQQQLKKRKNNGEMDDDDDVVVIFVVVGDEGTVVVVVVELDQGELSLEQRGQEQRVLFLDQEEQIEQELSLKYRLKFLT